VHESSASAENLGDRLGSASDANGLSKPLAAARFYAAVTGWHVLACRGKVPLTEHGLHDSTLARDTIDAWWSRWPGANIGIDCGRSGLLVVDVDVDGLDAWADLCARNGGHDPTLAARTPRGGVHVYFAAGNPTARSTVARLAPGVHTRGQGGYVIAPPSVGANGNRYEWIDPDRSGDPPGLPPSWLARLLLPPPSPPSGERCDLPAGERITRYG
jgi:hypothetical protein